MSPVQRYRVVQASTLGGCGAAALIAGLVIDHENPLAPALILLGAVLLVTAAVIVTLALAIRGYSPPRSAPSQRSGLMTYPKVSRYVRGGIAAVVGVVLIVAGVIGLADGVEPGAIGIAIGSVACLLSGLNFWLASRVLTRSTESETATPTAPTTGGRD